MGLELNPARAMAIAKTFLKSGYVISGSKKQPMDFGGDAYILSTLSPIEQKLTGPKGATPEGTPTWLIFSIGGIIVVYPIKKDRSNDLSANAIIGELI